MKSWCIVLLLGIGAQGQVVAPKITITGWDLSVGGHPLDDLVRAEIPDESEWGTKANGSCIIGGPMILNQAINQAAQKAADETDGKPLSKLNCTMDAFTHKITPPECADEDRMDVPAVQVEHKVNVCSGREFWIPQSMTDKQMGEYCFKLKKVTTCADKSRVLLTSEAVGRTASSSRRQNERAEIFKADHWRRMD